MAKSFEEFRVIYCAAGTSTFPGKKHHEQISFGFTRCYAAMKCQTIFLMAQYAALKHALALSYPLPRTHRLIGGMSPQQTGAGPRGTAPDTPSVVP